MLVGAQFWAYGPAGKADAVAHHLKNNGIRSDFVGHETSLEFCRRTDNFSNLIELSSESQYANLSLDKYDAVISVMDPYLAYYAKKMNKKVFYVDSMSWFWIWKNKNNIFRDLNYLETCSPSFGLGKIKNLIPDDRQLIAHLYSDRIFSQGIPQCIPATKHKNVNAGSVIDLSYRKKNKRDTVLVSLSGGISPATNLKAAVRYAEMIMNMIEGDMRKIKKATRFIITGHPSVINKIKKNSHIFDFKSMNHAEFLTELNRAIVTIVPCGFTTIFESIAYGTPVMFLPDNHNGHAYEFQIISNNSKSDKNQIFPNLLFPLGKSSLKNIRTIEESMEKIEKFTNLYFDSADFRKNYSVKWRKMINIFNEDESIFKKQKDAISYFIPTFEGAKFVSKEIMKKI
ncbi:MAG: hypothetical protein ACD_9C00029G0001 [uncultured bacterium]|nr:MAG: hypothetical protein ACD_9C00029G0001 [uncultured bacterium]